jgi:hypothetical protein
MRAEWSECRRAAEERDELSSPHDPLRETQRPPSIHGLGLPAFVKNDPKPKFADRYRHYCSRTFAAPAKLGAPAAAAAGTYAART